MTGQNQKTCLNFFVYCWRQSVLSLNFFIEIHHICLLTQICSLLRGGIAERGGVRVGHRIIEINNQSVVAVAHEKIVSMLASSVGEVTKYYH